MNKNRILNSLFFVLIILIVALSRLLPHPDNVTPIAALALYAPVFRKGWITFIVPFAALVFSDIFLGFSLITLYVYGSFLFVYFIGYLLREKFSYFRLASFVFASSSIFFIVTNLGVWIHYPIYEKSISGLMECYIMAIPFYRNTLIGDLVYSFALFGITKKIVLRYRPQYLIKEKEVSAI